MNRQAEITTYLLENGWAEDGKPSIQWLGNHFKNANLEGIKAKAGEIQ